MSRSENPTPPKRLNVHRLEDMIQWIRRDLVPHEMTAEAVDRFLEDLYYAPTYRALMASGHLQEHGEIPGSRKKMKHSLLSLDFCVTASDEATPRPQLVRAAALTRAALSVREEIREGRFAPDTHRDQALEMGQFANLFGKTLRAAEVDNELVEAEKATHIAVLVDGHAFRLQVIGEDGEVATVQEILAALERITEMRAELESRGSIGLITCLPRQESHTLRQSLTATANAGATLDMMDSALFVLALDAGAPERGDDEARDIDRHATAVFSASYWNRWYDKSCQIVVCADGSAGCVFNFACYVDGGIGIRFVDEIRNRAEGMYPTPGTPPTGTRILCFPLTIPDNIRDAAEKETARYLRGEHQSVFVAPFDKELVKRRNLSPDSLVQMAILLGCRKFFSDTGRPHELRQFVSVRQYAGGTLDCPYATTREAADFVERAFTEPDYPELPELLRKAVASHKRVILDTVAGRSPKVVLNYLARARPEHVTLDQIKEILETYRGQGLRKYIGDVFGLDKDTGEIITSALNLRPGTTMLGRPGIKLPYLTHLGLHYFVRRDRIVFVHMPAIAHCPDDITGLEASIEEGLRTCMLLAEKDGNRFTRAPQLT